MREAQISFSSNPTSIHFRAYSEINVKLFEGTLEEKQLTETDRTILGGLQGNLCHAEGVRTGEERGSATKIELILQFQLNEVMIDENQRLSLKIHRLEHTRRL